MGCRLVTMPFLTIALLLAGCATTVVYNPFRMPEEEFKTKIKRLALTPVEVLVKIEDMEPVKTKFEALIERKLREAGFAIVPARDYPEINKRMTEQIGGYFDPVTGKRDEAKFKTVREHVLREISAKYKVDALLRPAILPVPARFQGMYANWHGIQESVTGFGTLLLEGLARVQYSGSIAASSLGIRIEDMHGVPLYFNFGGIQLLQKRSLGQKFEPVPRNELFIEEERLRQAVDIALGPLIGKPVSTEATPEPDKEP